MKTKAEAATPVAKKESATALSTALDFSADSGMGFEGADSKSYAIPFLGILQGTSPQLSELDGARPGHFWNNITQEVMETVKVIPCGYQRRYIRWAPRSAGGGFKGEVDPVAVDNNTFPGLSHHNNLLFVDVPAGVSPVDAQGKPLFDILSDTRVHFLLYQEAGGLWVPALLSLASTQIKKSMRWMMRMQMLKVKGVTPPMFSHTYELSSEEESNAKGSWHGLTVTLGVPLSDPALYSMAKAFHLSVSKGQIQVTPPPSAE